VIASYDPSSPERDRRGSVTFGRFSDDILFWKTLEQFSNCAFLFGVCQDQSAVGRDKAFEAPQRFFE